MSNTRIDKGIITYIYLENFVTYDKVVVKPGRNLNVIIGPNGTGKSTIVCAIVLGLGGKPSTIGRAVHVGDYVKAGRQEAKIEIHLKNGRHKDIVITRSFDVKGKSVWFLNDKPSNIKAVQELTQQFDIQVDNLCQFLPQDKVQDFSKMNAQELLENTERSVGDPMILKYHKELINHRSEHKSLETQIANKKKLLHSKSQIHEGLKETVSSVKERKLIKKKITTLKQKKAWMLYDQMRRDLVKLKRKKEEIINEKVSVEEKIKPINDTIAKIKSEITLLQNSVTDHNNKVNVKSEKLKRMMNEILDCEKKIKEYENSCKNRIEVEQTRNHEIEVAQQQKNKLDGDLSLIINDIGTEESLMDKVTKAVASIEGQRKIITSLTNQRVGLEQREKLLSLEIRAQEDELQLLNIETKRLQLLSERSIDTYRAVHWLRENRDKFSGMVYEPMLLNINVKNASYAQYLEKIIPFRDLIAFVCENKQDMNLLLQHLRDKQNLQVNAVHSDPAKNVFMEPNIPLERITQFGFTHYLVSLIEAPPTIMKYLVSMYNLHNIPVGTNAVESNVDRIPNSLSWFFSENNFYAVSVSKYSREKSTRMQPVISTGTLSIVQDKSKLLRIEGKIRLSREQKNSVFNHIKKLEEEICKQTEELDKHRDLRTKYQQSVQQIQALKFKISMVDKKIRDLENERTSVEQIRESYTNNIKVVLNKQLKIYKLYNTELEECFKCVTDNEQIKLALKLQNRLLRAKTNDSQDLREKLKAAEEKLRQLTVETQPLKSNVQRMYNEALQTTDGISPSDKEFTSINNAFRKLPATIDEINNELNIAQAKVFCMGNNVDGENILREYETVESEIQNLKEFIQSKSDELSMTVKKMETLREQWLTPLKEIVNRINTNFSSYFSAMDCAGEVTLSHGENIMDFDQYGLKIRVKFRDTDQLQELTRHHQSGGERAVTTAIYMISLQELSRVPFRCVDEINQGMDAINERRIFNLLVKMTGRPDSSQYFLLTPKLLPGLQYAETVRVHCVFNGPFVISHTEFDTEEYCKHVVNTIEKETVEDY